MYDVERAHQVHLQPVLTKKQIKALGKNLAYQNLSGLDLKGLDLSHTDLTGACLVGAHLDTTELKFCTLIGTNFNNTIMGRGPDLYLARLDRISFETLYKSGAYKFGFAELYGIDFTGNEPPSTMVFVSPRNESEERHLAPA